MANESIDLVPEDIGADCVVVSESETVVLDSIVFPNAGAYDWAFYVPLTMKQLETLPQDNAEATVEVWKRSLYMRSVPVTMGGVSWRLGVRKLTMLNENDVVFGFILDACGSERDKWSMYVGRLMLTWQPTIESGGFENYNVYVPPHLNVQVVATMAVHNPGFEYVMSMDCQLSELLKHMPETNREDMRVCVRLRGVSEVRDFPLFYRTPTSPSANVDLPIDCTVTLVLPDDRRFYASRSDLTTFSEYFRALFESRRVLNSENEANRGAGGNEVCLEDEEGTTSSQFQLFLQCLLPPFLPLTLALQSTFDFPTVLHLADKYQCLGLKSNIAELLIGRPSSYFPKIIKIKYGDAYHMPRVVSFMVELMDVDELRDMMGRKEAEFFTHRTKALMFDRCRELTRKFY